MTQKTFRSNSKRPTLLTGNDHFIPGKILKNACNLLLNVIMSEENAE